MTLLWSFVMSVLGGGWQGCGDWVRLFPVACLGVLVSVHSCYFCSVFSSSKAILFRILTMFQAAKSLFSRAVDDFDGCAPGSLQSWGCLIGVMAFPFLLELGLQGVPFWLIQLCVLHRCLHPEIV